MRRKFLGERIDPNVDAVRPASMALTAEDLMNIPIFKFDDQDIDYTNADNNKYGKRLSRKFGGTIKLKKRLESVPEILIYDHKKLLQSEKRGGNQYENGNHNGIIVPRILLTQYGNINRPSNEPRPKNLQERRVLQRRISSQKMFSLPELPELKESLIKKEQPFVSNEKCYNQKKDFPGQQESSITFNNNDNNKIFQNIHACYSTKKATTNDQYSGVFNPEVERVLNHIVKIENMNKLQKHFGTKDINHLCLPTKINSTPLTPRINSIDSQLDKSYNFDEFMNSTPSSSLTEGSYSLNSPNLSTTTYSSSAYDTALEEFDSLGDLSITKVPSTISDENKKNYISRSIPTVYSRTNDITKGFNQIRTMSLRKTEIKPLIATMNYSNDSEKDQEEDEDDYVISAQFSTNHLAKGYPRVNTIQYLQKKIDDIELTKHNTILSASSSVYSER